MQPERERTNCTLTSYQSGKTWQVALRGRELGQSYCNCPDFRNNHSGTCKHILFALNTISQQFSLRALAKPWPAQHLSLRLEYAEPLGLRFEVPHDLDVDARRTVAPFSQQPTTDAAKIVHNLKKLARAGHSVYLHPDAEAYIDGQLQQSLRVREGAR